MVRLVAAYVAVLSLVGFAVMAWDKQRAQRRRHRVRERVLLGLAVSGGAWGVWLAMLTFHHKTRKLAFRIVVPVAAAAWTSILVWSWWNDGSIRW